MSVGLYVSVCACATFIFFYKLYSMRHILSTYLMHYASGITCGILVLFIKSSRNHYKQHRFETVIVGLLSVQNYIELSKQIPPIFLKHFQLSLRFLVYCTRPQTTRQAQ